jgi:glycolate oxidase iron-sulfur subunit
MQTHLAEQFRNTADGEEAEAILRRCVHCGFCTATCPTYQLLGDELDGPRGRIYLIKQVMEGQRATASTQQHLDRCLTCRNCETTCPSGVEYGKLVDIGRRVVDAQVPRAAAQRALRNALKEGLTSTAFAPAMKLGQWARPFLPGALRNKVPAPQPAGVWPAAGRHDRRVLMLEGCVQPAMQPNINTATARVLDAVGVSIVRSAGAGCCGAIRHHLNDEQGAHADMKRNIDAWVRWLDHGAEAIVMNASGCGAMVKDYGHQLRNDSHYAEKAARVSAATVDLAEWMPQFEAELKALVRVETVKRVAFHPPCTLQHGQQIRGKVEGLMGALGFEVVLPGDSHLCCGSAGTYSVLQPELAMQLRDRKLAALQDTGAAAVCSANIGCITHLQAGTGLPVQHWIEMIDAAMRASRKRSVPAKT